MDTVWAEVLLSVAVVSVISLLGAGTLAVVEKKESPAAEDALLHFFVALAIGALIGDVFIHLMPEAFESVGRKAALYATGGFALFFVLEKMLHWRHHHKQTNAGRIEPYGVMNLVGDALHNFIDGALIAASYLIAFPIGLATTVAVILHEIPQELGDYAILRSAGFGRRLALGFNFLSAIFSVIGAVVVLLINVDVSTLAPYILAFTAGGFIYIAFILVRKLGEDITTKRAFGQLIAIALGVILMWAIAFVG